MIYFSNHASYILAKFSDFWYNENMYCRHVYEYVYQDTCPDCGRYTHEPDHELASKLFKEHYETGQHLSYKCPVEGGTIRGWWSI